MSISKLEVNARQQAVADLMSKFPDISDADGASKLGIGVSSFRRYKEKIRNCYSNAIESAKSKSIQKAYNDLKSEVDSLRVALKLKDEELKQYAALSEMHQVDAITVQDADKREIVPVIVASDWHIEETVCAEVTNGLNEYNLRIAEESVRQFFSKACTEIQRSKRYNNVNTVVLAILGDIINGVLRTEDYETNETTPIEAIAIARSLIHEGIKMLISNTGCKLRVICCVGNHGRLTEKIHYSNQVQQNLEYMLYRTLETDFTGYKNVKFVVRKSYYTIQRIFNVDVRFHHGHAARFNGGIGGLAVPVIRKTQQMNTIEHADLDVIGHFHSAQTFSNVIVNGSLVGSNGFSMSLGMPHDIPKQTYFEIDSIYGKTTVSPICIDREVEKSAVTAI
jgi:hypothetical protein